MRESPLSPESTFEQQIKIFLEEYKNLEDDKDELLEPVRSEWGRLYAKWKNDLGLSEEWRDVTEDILASMDDFDKAKYNYMKGLEDALDQRAFELYDALLETVSHSPLATWIRYPQEDSFAGQYIKQSEMPLDENIVLRLCWMTQPRNAQLVMLMPNGANRDKALRNRMDTLCLSINEKEKGPLSVKGGLGISISREYGTDNEYDFPEDVKSQFHQEELARIKMHILNLKEQQFGSDF